MTLDAELFSPEISPQDAQLWVDVFTTITKKSVQKHTTSTDLQEIVDFADIYASTVNNYLKIADIDIFKDHIQTLHSYVTFNNDCQNNTQKTENTSAALIAEHIENTPLLKITQTIMDSYVTHRAFFNVLIDDTHINDKAVCENIIKIDDDLLKITISKLVILEQLIPNKNKITKDILNKTNSRIQKIKYHRNKHKQEMLTDFTMLTTHSDLALLEQLYKHIQSTYRHQHDPNNKHMDQYCRSNY